MPVVNTLGAVEGEVCPECQAVLARVGDAPSWCPLCQWRLPFFEPEYHRDGTGWQRVDRWLYQLAYRRTSEEFAAHSGRPPARPGWSTGRISATAVAALVHVGVLLCLGLGAWLCALHFPGLPLLPGLVLVAIAVQLWPRARRITRHAAVLERSEAPALYELVGVVASAIRVPMPHVVCLDDWFAADAGVHGLLRRRHLLLGTPLWAALSPQQRVALLAHQLAHFANGDPRRGPLIGPIDSTLTKLALILTPGRARTIRALQDTAIIQAAIGSGGRGLGSTGDTVWISELVWMPIAAVLRGAVALLRLLLTALPLRDVQRAEYLADALAAQVAGSAATTQLLDLLVSAESVTTLLRVSARAGAPAASWPAQAARILADAAAELPLRRQLNVRRGVSPVGAHLPLGLRASMLESRPPLAETVTLNDVDNARIDAELARYYRQVSRDLVNG
jgi:Zn-dependent protease with chaperone function